MLFMADSLSPAGGGKATGPKLLLNTTEEEASSH